MVFLSTHEAPASSTVRFGPKMLHSSLSLSLRSVLTFDSQNVRMDLLF